MNRPIFPWPFPADPKLSAPKPATQEAPAEVDMEPGDEPVSAYCTCDLELTQQEVDTGKCAACGKELFP